MIGSPKRSRSPDVWVDEMDKHDQIKEIDSKSLLPFSPHHSQFNLMPSTFSENPEKCIHQDPPPEIHEERIPETGPPVGRVLTFQTVTQ